MLLYLIPCLRAKKKPLYKGSQKYVLVSLDFHYQKQKVFFKKGIKVNKIYIANLVEQSNKLKLLSRLQEPSRHLARTT